MQKAKKVVAMCLVYIMLIATLPQVAYALPLNSNSLQGAYFIASAAPEYGQRDYTLNDIREILQQGNAHGYVRAYQPDGSVTTHQLTQEEVVEMFGLPAADNNIRTLNSFNYTVRAIYGEGRNCSESIVLILLGDGFTEGNAYGDVGHWPNPAPDTFLYTAYEFANILVNMYPFSLFSDYFKIYAVETPSIQRGIRAGTFDNQIDSPYLGTYFGSFIRGGISTIRVDRLSHALDVSNWVSSNTVMTQMILNSTYFGGIAFNVSLGYENTNSLGATTRHQGYHHTIIHEIGHNFGKLADEGGRGQISTTHANVAHPSNTDEQLKWGHWLGHERITRRVHQSATFQWMNPAPSNTCIMQSFFDAGFCAVCRSELTRRMALISGDTFEAGRRPDGSFRPVVPTVTVSPQKNRLLPYAFHGNRTLQTLHIPANITTIGDFAFIGATNLQTIINHRTTPQPINDTTFRALDRSTIDVFVPIGTRDAYIAAGWYGFRIHEGLNFNTITYNPNEGSPTTPIVDTVPQGSDRPLRPENTFTRPRYIFTGWATYDGITFTPGQTIYNIQSDLVLYAQWEPIPITDIIIYPIDGRDDAYINLTHETLSLPTGFHPAGGVAGFSINGGRTWRRGSLPTGNRWHNLFNRQMTLVLSNQMTPRGTARPLPNAELITFPQIQARPRRNPERLRPFYSAETWMLMTRTSNTNPIPQLPSTQHEYVRGTSAGRLPQDPDWQPMTDFEILQRLPSGQRNAFHFRTAASAIPSGITNPLGNIANIYTPAGRVFRVNPRSFGNETRLRINYTTETLPTSLSHEISTDNGITWNPSPRTIVNGRERATPLDISSQITNFPTTDIPILVRTASNGRRPGSAAQTITPQPRTALATTLPLELPISQNGVIDPQTLRQYSVLTTAANGTQRWANVPRITANNAGTFAIRMNPTARASGNTWSGNAASITGTLHVEWGIVGQDSRDRNIMGVTRAVITEYGAVMPAPTTLQVLPQAPSQAFTPPPLSPQPDVQYAPQSSPASPPAAVDTTTPGALGYAGD